MPKQKLGDIGSVTIGRKNRDMGKEGGREGARVENKGRRR